MRYGYVLLALSLAYTAGSAQMAEPSFVPGAPTDEAAIRHILELEEKGDESRVAPDLDWENAFGIRYTDEKKRAIFYHAAVDPLQVQSKRVDLETRIKFVAPTIAIVDVYGHRVGQIDRKTGKAGADRWLRNTYIFKKEHEEWIQVAERIADLRLPWYKHYDAMPAAVPVPAPTLASYAGKYKFAHDDTAEEVSVAGDHLLMKSEHGSNTLIPTSPSEFLSFAPDDLAEYDKVTFHTGTDGKLTLSLANETGEPLATAIRTP